MAIECKADNCEKASRKRGWCDQHYQQFWVRGNVDKKYERIPTDSLQDRLYKRSKINPETKCREWTKSLFSSGYGNISVLRKSKLAHVLSWEIANNQSAKGFVIRHTCDNKLCINPEHLISGTHLDNSRDMLERNREARGSKNGSAKLTEDIVKTILIMLNQNRPRLEIRKTYKVSKSCIGAIARRKTWKHVEICT